MLNACKMRCKLSQSAKPTHRNNQQQPTNHLGTSRSTKGCQISRPLSKLLNLVPPFKETVAAMASKKEWPNALIHFAESSIEPVVLDAQNPAVKLVIKGQEIPDYITNVISKATCHRLGINQWEACPFWLRIADMSFVRPLYLIQNLEIIIDGHAFQISAVVQHLNASDAYPILLRSLWLWTTNIKQNWHRNIITF